MKLFKDIGLKNPIATYLKEEITKVILEHFKTDSIKKLPKEMRQEVRLMIKQQLSKEHLKVKKNWKEFKNAIEPLERKAFKIALINSKIQDYYMEQSTDVIAIPKESIKSLISIPLQVLFEKNDTFVNMENATIVALTKYAIYMQFDKILKSFKDEKELLFIEDFIYILSGEINDDLYYINDGNSPARNSMLFFTSVEELSLDLDKKEIEEKCQEASEKWERFNKKRPEDSRFIFMKDKISWDIPEN
ncbi:MAG: hypothetical protein HXX16_12460 [Bacteroidales bacterium]|nr:hypothetical protein [Bacteroidales bacterium]